MDFALTGEQEMLKALVERFAAARYGGNARARYRAEPNGYSAENWALLAELGLLGLPFAEANGGIGGTEIDLITVFEAFGRGLVVEPVLNEIVVAGQLIERAATAGQRARLLPRIIAGQAHVALAHAEHGARYRLGAVATRYANGRLDGAKTFVQGGAECYIVTAQGPDGFTLVLADAADPGIAARPYRLVDGAVAVELTFDNAAAQPLAANGADGAPLPEASALATLEAVVQTARLAASAEMVGLMSVLFEMTLDYVRQRHQFGAPIGSFQAIQHRLADLYVGLELSRSQLYRAVLTETSGRDAAIAAAKSFIAATAVHLGEECIQFHGGMGVSDELAIGHAHKRILVLARTFGDPDHELARYTRALTRAGRQDAATGR